MKIDLTNKTALITGATRGIGKSTAYCFHQAGANLILTGTNQQEIENLNKENKRKGIFNIQYLQADFSNAVSTEMFLRKLDEVNQIDICVNNAGVNKVNDFIDTTIEEFNWINEINLNIPYRILKVVGPKMIENKYGRIVNIASIWSIVTRHGRSMYTSSKNALVGLTKTLAIEWASCNVLVNAVSPGFTITELTKTTNSIEELIAIEKLIPLKRMAEPIEIARTVAFLCSGLNTYITGQNITVDGGYTNV
jgi:3-oxoacyl-[acyl-carrier protein] reductase